MKAHTKIYMFEIEGEEGSRRAFWRAEASKSINSVADDIAAAFPREGTVKVKACMNEQACSHIRRENEEIYGLAA